MTLSSLLPAEDRALSLQQDLGGSQRPLPTWLCHHRDLEWEWDGKGSQQGRILRAGTGQVARDA